MPDATNYAKGCWHRCCRTILHTLPAPTAAGSRHPFRMPESTLRNWDAASANWRICPTLFESAQRFGAERHEPRRQGLSVLRAYVRSFDR